VRLLPASLRWRTLGVIVVALVLSQAVAVWLQHEYVSQPRHAVRVGQFVSHLKTIDAALAIMAPGERDRFIAQMAEKEGIRISPVRGDERVRPAANVLPMRIFRERIREIFGPEAEVYVRGADIARASRGPPLARAAAKLGKGGNPAPIAETGPSEIRAVARAFNQMKEDLRANERERATFLAGISHDLRTPLSRLRLEVEMLGAKVDSTTQRGIVQDLDDMNAIIDQFIDFTRTESAEPPMPVRLSELARSCAERAQRGGVAVACELAEVPARMLRPLAMQRLIDNLITNAARHAGGEILLRTALSGDRAILSVLDRGPGIPPAQVERLKQPFTRRDAARSGSSGAGLGLAIADRVATLHGGTLELLPREGGGLEARLTLPLAS
jgi:two-component system osmolarity sensor histidine kinase EnvZ